MNKDVEVQELTVDDMREDLYRKLWDITSHLRGNMSDQDYKNYILGLLFYMRLSDRSEEYLLNTARVDIDNVRKILQDEDATFVDIWTSENEDVLEIVDGIEIGTKRDLGFFVKPQYFFNRFNDLINIEKEGFDIELLEEGVAAVIQSTQGEKSEELFEGIFDDLDLKSNKLGTSVKDRTETIAMIISKLSEINLYPNKSDIIGDAYEYLIGKFATNSGAKSGSFYTPYQVGRLMGQLIATEKKSVESAGDFTGGSGSLLLTLTEFVDVDKLYYQELITNTFNLARMNMLLHGRTYNSFKNNHHDFTMYNGDALKYPAFIEDKIDVIVANPPYSQKWSSDKKYLNDERFSGPGKLAPKSYADYAFLLTMYHSLADEGMMTIVLPHGVLFRGGAEGSIREWLIKENAIDGIIGLPEDIFFGTSIPTAILILKKGRKNKDIFFIDAKDEFQKAKAKNSMADKHVEKIVAAYKNREPIERFADIATLEDIEENDYNLNIPRYVDTFEPEEDINVRQVQENIKDLKREIYEIDLELDKYFRELGLPGVLGGDKYEKSSL